MSRVAQVLVGLLGLVALLTSVQVLVGAYGPLPGERAQQSLVDALEREIADGADVRAQRLFPEGAYFSHVLTGIAQARLGGADNLARARVHLARTRSPDLLAGFGSGMVPEHGIFAAGWSLQLAVDIARASEEQADLAVAAALASEVSAAFERSPTPYLASYPDQYWPCDSVVAVAGLAGALELPAVAPSEADRWLATVRQWRRASAQLHPAGTLLPHRTTAAGTTLEGPRGSSQAIIQTFWPELAPDDARSWAVFTSRFVTVEAGLVGVREHPRGTSGAGDVDSGPLVLGVSLSATTVALGAARANRDLDLAADLDHEAEVFGVPTRIGPRRYAAGVMPIGEAFLAFARSRTPAGPAPDPILPPDRPSWVLWWGPGLLVAGLVSAGLTRSVGRRRRGAPAGS